MATAIPVPVTLPKNKVPTKKNVRDIIGILLNDLSRDKVFQCDWILETELSEKWISVFRIRVQKRFYESKVVKLISIHPVFI